MAYRYKLVVPQELASVIRKDCPGDVFEYLAEGDILQTTFFVISTVGPHIEWLISLYWQLKEQGNNHTHVRLVRNESSEEVEFDNVSPDEIVKILEAWKGKE